MNSAERSEGKLVITGYRGSIASVLFEEGLPVQISLEPEETGSILGNVYLGRVQNVVKNLNAAFVEIAPGVAGYYSLEENRRHWFAGAASGDGAFPEAKEGPVKAGDTLMVQVERDAVKTKAPVLTGNVTLTGKYCVFSSQNSHISFSGKLSNREWKTAVRAEIEAKNHSPYGLIVRTNAGGLSAEEIFTEFSALRDRFVCLAGERNFRTDKSLLYQAPAGYVNDVKNAYSAGLSAVVTDRRDIYDTLAEYLRECQPEDLEKLNFYEDPLLSLGALYSLETVISEALQPRVWLRSGGYLVIEPTEALTVIDVNTGKYAGKKAHRDTLMKINLEAADAVAWQIRLRNLSGIIIVDFIDMETEEDKEALLDHLRRAVRKDPVKTAVVDMTPLNLAELTRKKIKRPLHEQVRLGRR